MARIFVILGILFLVLGFGWTYMEKLGLGNLPGDIVIRGENSTFHFPIVTCLIISVVLTLLFRFFGR